VPTPISVVIVLHGLVALVPTLGKDSNHMTALMLDTRSHMADDCMVTHSPQLVFDAASDQACESAGCHLSSHTCTCTDSLVDKEVSLVYDGTVTHATGYDLTTPPPPMPGSKAAASSFAYVANFSREPYSAHLKPNELTGSPPPELYARMSFDFDTVAACNLFVREDAGQAQIVTMTPRPLGARSSKNENGSQAMAQMVVARSSITLASDASPAVSIRLHDMTKTSNAEDLIIPLASSDDGYRIDFANDTPPLSPDAPCDDGVARHFALFYQLTDYKGRDADRLIPHFKYFLGQDPRTLASDPNAPDPCSLPNFNLQDRPACPMAVILPPGTN
jgi:hypothetical protein